ncbi:MAG: DUF4136 domain-containing protein [Steroidobacter sp.]
MSTLFSSFRTLGVAAFATAILLAGCATVQTDYDPRVNVHNYHSYVLEYTGNTNAAAFNNPLNAKRLRDAIEGQLASRGMHAVAEGETPDCIVSVSTGSRQVVENEPATPRIGIGFGWYHHGIGGSMAFDNDVYAYNEHRIAIDLLDGKSREPVWHASISENINRGSGASAEARIKDVVAQMFAKYP